MVQYKENIKVDIEKMFFYQGRNMSTHIVRSRIIMN